MSLPRYRPALRSLIFGIAALALRGVELLAVTHADPRDPAATTDSSGAMRAFEAALESALQALPWMNLVATLIALVGVGYAAIAAHRREWGVVLVLAWIASVGAVLYDVQPFVFVGF